MAENPIANQGRVAEVEARRPRHQDDEVCPTFSHTSCVYLLRAAEFDCKTINLDSFGPMMQTVAVDAGRGELGMHCTSVPDIRKVFDPAFLDDLPEQFEVAGEALTRQAISLA